MRFRRQTVLLWRILAGYVVVSLALLALVPLVWSMR